jgi:hypothetical protein
MISKMKAPNNIFQVGDGARLKIFDGIGDYSLIGTKDVDDASITKTVVSGNTRNSPLEILVMLQHLGIIIFVQVGPTRSQSLSKMMR